MVFPLVRLLMACSDAIAMIADISNSFFPCIPFFTGPTLAVSPRRASQTKPFQR
jgi:hypothetical protein